MELVRRAFKKTHKRYRIRHKEGPYEVYNGKNITFLDSGIILEMNDE
jgi:hypothetical protein